MFETIPIVVCRVLYCAPIVVTITSFTQRDPSPALSHSLAGLQMPRKFLILLIQMNSAIRYSPSGRNFYHHGDCGSKLLCQLDSEDRSTPQQDVSTRPNCMFTTANFYCISDTHPTFFASEGASTTLTYLQSFD